jgi:ADP-heptose:LPS heptosyltransferase
MKETRKLKPDLALDFQGLLRSAFIARMSGAKEVYGMSDGREGSRFFYKRAAKVSRHEHAVERYLKLAELAGAKIGDALRCPLPTGDPLPRFEDYPPYILLHPFARGSGKSLTNRLIEEICAAFAPTRVVVVGKTNRDIDVVDVAENCVELTNQTSLLQLIRLIRFARFVISVDSGPMHIAAAVNDRLLSIHTWTNPRRVGPYNPDAWIWKHGKIVKVSELENAKLKRHGRPFKSKDIPDIVELIRPLVPIDPMLV